MSINPINLWETAQNEYKKSNSNSHEHRHLIFLGSKHSGKTTLILNLLDKEIHPKPSFGLEYTFARLSEKNEIKKTVNIWEIAYDTDFYHLLSIPLEFSNLFLTTFILVIDLSHPDILLSTILSFIKVITSYLNALETELKFTSNNLFEELKCSSFNRYGVEHPDKDLLTPLLTNFVIIGSKYDLLLERFPPDACKTISKTLRFFAHTYGGSLYFYSEKYEGLTTIIRQALFQCAFGSPKQFTVQYDYTKALIIPIGFDSFGQIGSPIISGDSYSDYSIIDKPVKLWEKAYQSVFNTNSEFSTFFFSNAKNPSLDMNYLEPIIDSLFSQRNIDLKEYLKLKNVSI